jgi:hypothetical protein
MFATVMGRFAGALDFFDSSGGCSNAQPAKPSCDFLGVDTQPHSAGSRIAAASATHRPAERFQHLALGTRPAP